jgi:hypothetical protein
MAMTTQVERGQKILAYDGDCPMCTGTVALLTRWGLVRREQARSNHELSDVDLDAARAAGIRNQLIVLDPVTREARAGVEGLLWIVGDNTARPWWLRLLALAGVRHALGFGYETISYNRRVVSPPRQHVRCDCEPEVTLGRRLTLIVPLAAFATLVIAWFGAAVAYGWGLGDPWSGAALVLAAAGTSWAVMIVAALAFLRGQQRIDYIAHLVITAFVGVLVLLPACMLAWWLPGEANLAIAGISVLSSFAVMLAMQRRRVWAVGLSRRWLWGWVAALVLGFVGATLFFLIG